MLNLDLQLGQLSRGKVRQVTRDNEIRSAALRRCHYMPIINVIRDTNILKEFPEKTEGDLYLWVLDHQHYLAIEEGIPLQSPETAARTFLENKDK